MKDNKIFNIKLQILINDNLYEKKLIDEELYSLANDKLLKQLNKLKEENNYELWENCKVTNVWREDF